MHRKSQNDHEYGRDEENMEDYNRKHAGGVWQGQRIQRQKQKVTVIL